MKTQKHILHSLLATGLGLLLVLSHLGCSTEPTEISTGSPSELCEQGVARACAKQYKSFSTSGQVVQAEQTYRDLCRMPRIVCYSLKPEESFSSDSQIYEKLIEHDVWNSGRVTAKRVVLYRTIDVSPDHLKPPEKSDKEKKSKK